MRGCHFGLIQSTHRFQKTNQAYDASEISVHLANLETMMAFLKGFDDIHAAQCLLYLLPSSSPSFIDRFRPWARFLWKRRCQSSVAVLQELRKARWEWRSFTNFPDYTPRRMLMDEHLSFLQHLTSTDRTLFWCTLDTARHGADSASGQVRPPFACTKAFGIAHGNIQAGDTITWLDKGEPSGS